MSKQAMPESYVRGVEMAEERRKERAKRTLAAYESFLDCIDARDAAAAKAASERAAARRAKYGDKYDGATFTPVPEGSAPIRINPWIGVPRRKYREAARTIAKRKAREGR